MSHVPSAWSLCEYVLGTRVSCEKKAEPIELSFGGQTRVDPKNFLYMEVSSVTTNFGPLQRLQNIITDPIPAIELHESRSLIESTVNG